MKVRNIVAYVSQRANKYRKVLLVTGVLVVVALIVSQVEVGTHVHFSNGRIQSGSECAEFEGFLCPENHPHKCDGDFATVKVRE